MDGEAPNSDGHGSARWLELRGFPEVAVAVEHHPVTRLRNGDWFEAWLHESRAEDRIVAYADKRAEQRLVSLDTRFAGWHRRHGDTWGDDVVAQVRKRADRLEAIVCETAGLRPDEVRRQPWTAAALRRVSA